MDRSDVLVASVLNVCKLRDAWMESGAPRISNDFVEAMDELTAVFDDGDIPADCRVLFNEYPQLREEWRRFGDYASDRNPAPVQGFWNILTAMENYLLDHADDFEAPPMETLKELMEQKVPYRQIAIMYSHRGKGPFMRKGVPMPHLVKRELDKPGSVITADMREGGSLEGAYIHPAVTERLAAGRRVEKRLIQRAARLLADEPQSAAGGLPSAHSEPTYVPPTRAQLDAAETSGQPLPGNAPMETGLTQPDEEPILSDGEQDAAEARVEQAEWAGVVAEVHRLRNLSPNVTHRDIAESLNISTQQVKKALASKPGRAA